MNVVRVKGHWYPVLGRRTFDGRLKYEEGVEPDAIDVNGRIYRYDPEMVANDRCTVIPHVDVVTPEDGIGRETRGSSV